MSDLQTLRFYATPSHECSYIEGQQAKTLFVDPQAEVDKNIYSQLSDLGFRRSGTHIYRPHCEKCNACVSVRIHALKFKASKTQRRIRNKNQDLTVTLHKPYLNMENYALYEKYINARHSDGDMYPPSPAQFMSFLVEGSQDSQFAEFRTPEGTLVAVAIIDFLEQGLSALYTFYDPDLTERSLGTYAIMWEIEECQRREQAYLYLGYWVKNCRKMNYKTRFTPIDMLINEHWIRVSPNPV